MPLNLRKRMIRENFGKSGSELAKMHQGEVRKSRSHSTNADKVRVGALKTLSDYKMRREKGSVHFEMKDRAERELQIRNDPVFARLSVSDKRMSEEEYRRRHFAMQKMLNRGMTKAEYRKWMDQLGITPTPKERVPKPKVTTRKPFGDTPTKRRAYKNFWKKVIDSKPKPKKKK